MRIELFILSFLMPSLLVGQVMIQGRVIDDHSKGVPFAAVRLPGLDVSQADEEGFFRFEIPQNLAEAYYLKPGVDIPIDVEVPNMAILSPAEMTIRLPEDWRVQPHFQIRMAPRDSLLFIQSEEILEKVLRDRIAARLQGTDDKSLQRDAMGDAAAYYGFSKDSLDLAVDAFRDQLRTSPDLNKQGLALLDIADSSRDSQERGKTLDQAQQAFRAAIQKDSTAIKNGQNARRRLPELYFNLGLTFFTDMSFDSAATYFLLASDMEPINTEYLTRLGSAYRELGELRLALDAYNQALVIDTSNATTCGSGISLFLAAVPDNPIEYSAFITDSISMKLSDSANNICSDTVGFHIATELNNIGSIMEADTNYEGALIYYRRAFCLLLVLGPKYAPYGAKTLNNIGGVSNLMGDRDAALEYFSMAYDIDTAILEPDHPDIATRLNNIGNMLYAKGKYPEALEIYRSSITINSNHYSQRCGNISMTLYNIANLLSDSGDCVGAIESAYAALTIDTALYRDRPPRVANGLRNIVNILIGCGQFDNAYSACSTAYVVDSGLCGDGNASVTLDLYYFGLIFDRKRNYDSASYYYYTALMSVPADKRFKDVTVAKIYHNMGGIHLAMNDIAGAIDNCSMGLRIMQIALRVNSPDIAQFHIDLAFVLQLDGKILAAQDHLHRAKDILVAVYGPDHKKVQAVQAVIGATPAAPIGK